MLSLLYRKGGRKAGQLPGGTVVSFFIINLKKQTSMIRYKKYQNQTKSTPLSGKWLARAVADQTLDTRALAEHMAKHNTPYSQGAIHGVLKDMTSCIKELLLDGKNVKLDDLAIFGVGIRGKPAETSKDWSVTTNVVGLRLKCRATGTLAINQLKLEAQLKELSPYNAEEGSGGGGEEERPGEL